MNIQKKGKLKKADYHFETIIEIPSSLQKEIKRKDQRKNSQWPLSSLHVSCTTHSKARKLLFERFVLQS